MVKKQPNCIPAALYRVNLKIQKPLFWSKHLPRTETAMPTYQQIRYLLSAHDFSQSPEDRGVEVAFAGRSNAGKSSALNAITGMRSLARTSKTPGRTQALNFFGIDDERRLVDLPGYGFARVPEEVKRRWQRTLENYFRSRRSLRGLFLVMDIRHPLGEYDVMMLDWCREMRLPAHVLLTKADKLSRGAAMATLAKVRKELQARYGNPDAQLFSALKNTGIEEARKVLDDWLGVVTLESGERQP